MSFRLTPRSMTLGDREPL